MQNFIMLSSIIVFIYLVGLIFLLTRRRSAYIIRRSPLMLSTSLIGNLFQSLVYLSQIEEISKDIIQSPYTECEIFFRIRQSLNLLFHYTLFTPYILRVYRLYLLFKVDRYWEDHKNYYQKYIHRTKQSWMFLVFSISLLPLLALIIIILTNCQLSLYLPASESNVHENYSKSFYLVLCFIEELIFIFCIYFLRNVSDDYQMTNELGIVVIVWFVTPSLTVFPPVDFDNFKSLPGLLRNFILFFVTIVLPVAASFVYKIDEEFVTVEMLESFETFLQSKRCLEQFEKHLIDKRAKTNESMDEIDGFNLLMLYMKCENIAMLPNEYNKEELIQEILDIDVIPISYINNEKNILEVHLEKAKETIKKILFTDFFEPFKNSHRYLELKRLVCRQEIYLGRLLEVGLTRTLSAT